VKVFIFEQYEMQSERKNERTKTHELSSPQ